MMSIDSHSITAPILAGINESAEAVDHDVLLYTSWHSNNLRGGVRFLDGHIDGLMVVGLLQQVWRRL